MGTLLGVQTLLSELAWQTILLQSEYTGDQDAGFTGELDGAAYASVAAKYVSQLAALDQLNLTTRQAYFDILGYRHELFAWRHLSFCEWFAGLHLASLSSAKQNEIIVRFAFDKRWEWVFRFAMCAADRCDDTSSVETLSENLLSSGAAFLLHKTIQDDHIALRKVNLTLDTLCRWLCSRHVDGGDRHYPEDGKRGYKKVNTPPINEKVAHLLEGMFGKDRRISHASRDSRWLHPAWELVITGCESSNDTVRNLCCRVRDLFLGEFEHKVLDVASRNQGISPDKWTSLDRAVLQLLPDEYLLELGFLNDDLVNLIRNWPSSDVGTYEQRRDQFNEYLKAFNTNFCRCPPNQWEHPYINKDGSKKHPRECRVRATKMRRKEHSNHWFEDSEGIPLKISLNGKNLNIAPVKPHFLLHDYMLQRTPTTQIQYNVFDSLHDQYHPPRLRKDGKQDDPDRHPVTSVSWYQAQMFCIWLTGNGRFGRFYLPFDEDWEACCRAGRDAPFDLYGIPKSNAQGNSELDGDGDEFFNELSEGDANCYKGYFSVPVDQFKANGFGLVDMHGQVAEWMQNDSSTIRKQEFCDQESASRRGGCFLRYLAEASVLKIDVEATDGSFWVGNYWDSAGFRLSWIPFDIR